MLLKPTKHNKLEMEWSGPFKVEERFNDCDYWISMKGKRKLFHANMLKKYYSREEPVQVPDVRSQVAAIAVLDEEELETVSEDEIPTIPWSAEETTDDVRLDPESPEVHYKIRRLVSEYPHVLTDLPSLTSIAVCRIELDPPYPVRSKPYTLPYAKKEAVKQELDEMLRLGVIERSNSPFNSPIVLIKKKSGQLRFCLDLRSLNKQVVFDAEPMPDMEDLFAKLGKAKYFSKLDLTKGYWQIPLGPEDKAKTAFSTPFGHFQWTVMPFGLKTAGAVFSRMMREVIQPLEMEEVDNFMDDVLIATETIERHLECLEAVFKRLEEVSLTAKPSKCCLGFKEIEYLGFMVGRGVIKPVEDKMSKIKEAPVPSSKKQIKSFLGLAGFYRKFVPNFSEIASPLTDATKSGAPVKVIWTAECAAAFQELKDRLSDYPVCVLPDFDLPFVLRTDASNTGLGAILVQDRGQGDHPISCASRKLTSAERNYSTIEKELLAIVWGIRKFDRYLYGRHFFLESDHLPLKHLDSLKSSNSRLMRWALQIQPYSFTFRSIPGKENVGADFLSRLP